MMDSGKIVLVPTEARLLAVAPGHGMLYVLARSLAGGRREGVLSSLGTFVGGMVHVLAAAAGGAGDPARPRGCGCDCEICGRGVSLFSRRSHDSRSAA